MLEKSLRLQAAAGHERVGDAHGGSVAECDPYVEIIIFFQETSVNDAENVPLMLVPVIRGKLDGDVFKLFCQPMSAGNAVTVFQRRRHGVSVFVLILPEIGRGLMRDASRI